jgi:hypothetical protein
MHTELSEHLEFSPTLVHGSSLCRGEMGGESPFVLLRATMKFEEDTDDSDDGDGDFFVRETAIRDGENREECWKVRSYTSLRLPKARALRLGDEDLCSVSNRSTR